MVGDLIRDVLARRVRGLGEVRPYTSLRFWRELTAEEELQGKPPQLV